MVTKNSKAPFYLGDWCVLPEQCRLQNSETSQHLQPKLMEVLLFLADKHMQVISSDDLINGCWQGLPMTDNPIHKTIAQLRKALGDSSDSPKYIKTIPRKGYVLIAKMAQDNATNNLVEAYWRDQSPFLGASEFQAHQQSIFFGRQQALEDILSHIEQMGREDALMLHVSGESGCGKSSFVQAGLIPQLLNPQKQFELKFCRAIVWTMNNNNTSNDLLEWLYQHKVFSASYGLTQIQQLWQNQPSELIQHLRSKESDTQQRTVLFIDQMEQVINDESNSSQAESIISHLFQLIVALNNSKQFYIIFASRDGAGKKISDVTRSSGVSSAVLAFRLSTMPHTAYKSWIKSTMQASGLFFEVSSSRHESLLDVIVNAIERHQLSLTTVQCLLLKLYEMKDGSKLSYASFKKIDGFDGLINDQAERVFKSHCVNNQKIITEMFPQLVIFKSIVNSDALTHKITWQQAVTGFGVSLLTTLINQRLLKAELSGEQVKIGFTESSLPQVWNRLAQWVVSNRNQLLNQSEVQFMVARWLLNSRKNNYLMNRKDLAGLQIAKNQGFLLNENQQIYIRASKQQVKKQRFLKRSVQLLGLLIVVATAGSLTYAFKVNGIQQQTQVQLESLVGHIGKNLSPQLKSKGQLSLLADTHSKLLSVIEATKKHSPSLSLLNAQTASLNIMGELNFNDRNSDQAHELFARSEALALQSEHRQNPELLAHLMLSQYWLGYLGFVDSEYPQANKYWKAYLETALRLREIEPDNSEWQLEHSYALNNLGSLSEKTGALEQATSYFNQSIAIKSALLTAQPENMSLQADLADSLSWQGNIYRKQGLLKLALVAYQDSIELTQAMKSSKGQGNTKLHREILAFHRMATLVLDMGDLVKAHELAGLALEKSLLLNELDRENNGYKAELINLHLLNAQNYRYSQQFDSSLKHIQKANQLIDYFKLNLAMTPRIAQYQMQLKREQAMIFKHFGQIDSAKTAIETGLLTWEDYELSQKQSAQVSYSMLHLNMAQILQQEKLNLYQKANIQTINNHLEKAWQEIEYLLSQNPQDCQLMAISLAISYARNGKTNQLKYGQVLTQSEYRNPEFYQPLIENQLLSLN